MTNENSWSERVADAAKSAWIGAETAAIIASSPAAGLVDNNVHLSTAITDSALTTIAAGNAALSANVQARAEADRVAEETDIRQEPTTALSMDTPNSLRDQADVELSRIDDLASIWESEEVGDMGGGDVASRGM